MAIVDEGGKGKAYVRRRRSKERVFVGFFVTNNVYFKGLDAVLVNTGA